MIGYRAVLVTVWQILSRFWNEMRVKEPLKPWQDSIFETVQRLQQERASDGFIQAHNELLASGEVVLTQAKVPEEPRPGATVVGYEDSAYIYLLPEISYREAMRIRRRNWQST
jgi:hypothetical protein